MPSQSFTIYRFNETTPEDIVSPYRIGSGIADETDIRVGAQNKDHGQDAIDHLLPDYDNKPRIEAWLRAAGAQLTQLEAELVSLHRMKSLTYATGIYLDLLGVIVGEPRKARIDAAYKPYINIRILVNKSKGLAGDLYAIMMLALTGNTFVILDYVGALDCVALDDIGTLVPTEFVEYLKRAKPSGKRLKFGYTHEPTADTLILSGTNITPLGVLGGTNVTGGVAGGLVG